MKRLFSIFLIAILVVGVTACEDSGIDEPIYINPTPEPEPEPNPDDPQPDDPQPEPEPTPGKGYVVMNEVNTSLKYIELYNPSEFDADLSGYKIMKNNEAYMKNLDGSGDFVITDGTTLRAGEFAIIGCKGKDTQYGGLFLGVSSSGISGSKSLLLELHNAKGERVDYFVNSPYEKPCAVDEWDADVEHTFEVAGRLPDGEQTWSVCSTATAGCSNNTAEATATFTHTPVDFDSTTPNTPPTDPTPEPEPGVGYYTGLDYVYDMEALPEIHISVPLDQWNQFLKNYDADKYNDDYVECDATFTKGSDHYSFERAGLRLRGNTSRVRPEGNHGEMHTTDKTDWHHCHFMLNLRKFVKDDQHEIMGVRKLHLKWFKEDPCYVREVYSFDLFRRYGIWTALRSSYCRLWIHVEGDSKEAYYGVYEMLEAIDDKFIERRADKFDGVEGNVWKARWGASFRTTDDWEFVNDGGSRNCHYELKTNTDSFSAAKEQLVDFILKLNGKQGENFKSWIAEVCDVELLLKTYAVNVALGMWDDYWNNTNNFYFYFSTTDKLAYKFYFLPYDYDNTLGTSNAYDPARQNPLEWGKNENPLIYKIIQYDEWRKIYVDALKELASEQYDYLNMTSSVSRILKWQEMIRPYVDNDTDEDCEIYDKPASWGSYSHYRLMDMGSNNYFRVKCETLNNM